MATQKKPSIYATLSQNRQDEQDQIVNTVERDVSPTPIAPSEAAVTPAPEPVSEIKTYGRPKLYNSENPRTTTTLVLTADRKRKLQIYAINHDTNISGVISEFIDSLPDV